MFFYERLFPISRMFRLEVIHSAFILVYDIFVRLTAV